MPKKEIYWKYRDRIREENRRYYQKNKERIKRKRKEWLRKNKRRAYINWKVKKKNIWLARNWAEKHRKEILKIKGDKCEICGSIKDLQLHHIKYEKSVDSIRVLCRHCHNELHFVMNSTQPAVREGHSLCEKIGGGLQGKV